MQTTARTDKQPSHPNTLVTFKELVSSYIAGTTSFDELTLSIRCESCYGSVFDEAQDQLGAQNQLMERLADEFPNYHKSLAKERDLEI